MVCRGYSRSYLLGKVNMAMEIMILAPLINGIGGGVKPLEFRLCLDFFVGKTG